MFRRILEKILQLLAYILPKNRRLIIFGSYSGRHFADNSKDLYLYLLKNNPDNLRPVWLADDRAVIDEVRKGGGEAYNKKSLRGVWLSLIAGTVVTSHGLSDVLLYSPIKGRPKELYLHHGTPLRKQIFRNRGSAMGVPHKCSLERFKHITFSIATSAWAAEQQLNNIPVDRSRMKITGLPRNDKLLHKDGVDELKRKYGLKNFVVLYTPTWRRDEATRFFPFQDLDLNGIGSFLRERQISMILRPHHTDVVRQSSSALWKKIKENEDVFKIITLSECADTNDLLKLTDCLITDYSSIHYDYLLTGKPIIYLPYDMEEYVKKWGGFNCDYEKFTPGPKPKTQKEFLEVLDNFYRGEDRFIKARRGVKEIVHSYQDGNSCRRVYELIKNIL